MLSEKEGKEILTLAKQFIKSELRKKPAAKIDKQKYKKKSGVFVTLKKNGKLRGCIGYAEPIFPLIDALEKAAIAAAFSDPRFPPLQESELQDIKLEVSILSEPEKIEVKSSRNFTKKIKIGNDGLVVTKGMHSGLLLPQVAVEQGWDAQGFLTHTCMKAMLPPDAWLDKDTKIYKFQCQIFKE